MCSNYPKVFVDHLRNLPSTEKSVFHLDLSLLQTDFLLETRMQRRLCGCALLWHYLSRNVQSATCQPRSVCTPENKEKTDTHDMPRNGSHSLFCPRTLAACPVWSVTACESSPRGLGSPIQARRKQLPHFTQSFTSDLDINTPRTNKGFVMI